MEEQIGHCPHRDCCYCKPVVVEPRHIVDHHMLEEVDYILLDYNLVVDHNRMVGLEEDEPPNQS